MDNYYNCYHNGLYTKYIELDNSVSCNKLNMPVYAVLLVMSQLNNIFINVVYKLNNCLRNIRHSSCSHLISLLKCYGC